MTLILGIDPGTKCGWALIQGDQRIASGTWDLKSKRHEGGGMRYLRARSYMGEILRQHRPAMVAYEEVRRHAGTSAAHVYGGIVSQLTALCEELEVPYRAVPVGTVKKLATGKGNAGKAAMVEAANKRWGVAVGDDDEADALWVAETLRVEMDA